MAKASFQGSLLDCWSPPVINDLVNSGSALSPIGFIATTFTFDAEFFQDYCLTRFLNMQTDKESDTGIFLAEREEALANLRAGMVFVDQHHCKGNRNLRWDMVPCRVKNGIMHAKITILHWSDCVRLIVSSANLTQPGHCINQEVYGVFDYFKGCDSDLSLINELLIYMQRIIIEHSGDIVKQRFAALRTGIKKALQNWAITEKIYRPDEIRIQLLLISPAEKDGLVRLKMIWNSYRSSLPYWALVISPFFDEEELPFRPSKQIFDMMQREADIGYVVTTDAASESSDQVIVKAPAYLKDVQKPGSQTVKFYQVSEQGVNEENQFVSRPLHLKSIWMMNDDLNLVIAGSSNFTSAGFGLGRRTNYEANLVYTVSAIKNKKAATLLGEAHPEGEKIDENLMVFQKRPNEDEAAESALVLLLPPYLGEAVIKRKDDRYVLELQFFVDTYERPEGLEIFYEKNQQTVLLIDGDQLPEREEKFPIEWADALPPNFLLVKWNESNGFAFWPVIVESVSILPVAEDLRDLSLEALLIVIGSKQPLYRLLKRIERLKQSKKEILESEKIIDVHKLVDTAGFILQRTKRVSYALNALRIRLEKPVFTKESLEWRLNGPIGAKALADAIKKEARSNEEKLFLIAELSLELSRVKPQTSNVTLKKKEVLAAVKEVLNKLYFDLAGNFPSDKSSITDYSLIAIKKAIHELS